MKNRCEELHQLCLSKEDRQKVLDITKYLVLAQNTVVPAILQKNQSEGNIKTLAGYIVSEG